MAELREAPLFRIEVKRTPALTQREQGLGDTQAPWCAYIYREEDRASVPTIQYGVTKEEALEQAHDWCIRESVDILQRMEDAPRTYFFYSSDSSMRREDLEPEPSQDAE